jgi:predicted dehydrogenase
VRILVDDLWEDRFLDYWCGPGEVRLQVRVWWNVAELNDLYFEYPPRKSLRKLWDYGREVGPVDLARKVVSRLSETERNRKFVAIGIGELVDQPETLRAFVAPCHPACCERVVVPEALTAPWSGQPITEGSLRLVRGHVDLEIPDWLYGWQRESGAEPGDQRDLMTAVNKRLQKVDGEVFETLEVGPSEVTERRSPSHCDGLHAVLFGWGHYARTCVVPNLPPEIEVCAVHELDAVLSSVEAITDTAPVLRDHEPCDVGLIAGYHGTHAPLAAEALRRGAWAVSEKPIATTMEQLDELMQAWVEPSRYFAGFHRRYAPYNEWLRKDLAPSVRDPISYHCIVHEVSLPQRHWYRWPSSGSRLLSNGCHWIDHFLFLNDFAAVDTADAREVGRGEVVVAIELTNGATFTMTLTDRGSDRLGTREHTEVRVADRTAVIEDGRSYRAEDGERLIRREKFHKLAAHAAMYRSIGERIVGGEPGDSRRSVEASARLVLRLEDLLES